MRLCVPDLDESSPGDTEPLMPALPVTGSFQTNGYIAPETLAAEKANFKLGRNFWGSPCWSSEAIGGATPMRAFNHNRDSHWSYTRSKIRMRFHFSFAH